MQIDAARARAIIQEPHSYYSKRDVRQDTRWHPYVTTLIMQHILASTRVLDLGCGSGDTLLQLSPRIQYGLGLDNDPDHLRLAEEAKRAQGAQNVDFLLLDYPREVDRLQSESFDLVMSQRGPLGDTSEEVQAARRLLRTDGMLFCEEIGEQHQKEKMAVFFPDSGEKNHRRVDEVRGLFEQNDIDVRLAADIFTRWIFPDIYAWLGYECNLRTWLGIPLPEPDDPRIGIFAEQNSNAAGEIETTHHVVWVAGVKK